MLIHEHATDRAQSAIRNSVQRHPRGAAPSVVHYPASLAAGLAAAATLGGRCVTDNDATCLSQTTLVQLQYHVHV
eukprot:5370851-Prymnesium_polylepis.1